MNKKIIILLTSCKIFSDQRGIIIPLIAIFSSALIAFIFALGVDAALVKYASTTFRRDLDDRCKLVSYNAGYQRDVVSSFQQTMFGWQSLLRPSGLKLVRARVYAPVENPSDFAASPPAIFTACNVATGLCALSGCNSGPTFACEYAFDGSKFNTTAEGFPDDFWTGTNRSTGPIGMPHVGATVACDAVAEYSSWISGKKRLSARAAFWRPSRGMGKGLIVAAAPQMTTHSPQVAGNLRFGFTAGTAVDRYNYAISGNGLAFSSTRPQIDYPIGGDTFVSYPALSTSGTPSDQQEMLTACMNPAVLIRNIILSSILEDAMRSSFTRDLTDVVVVSPQHQDHCVPRQYNTIGGFPNPNRPTRIVNGTLGIDATYPTIGEDLAARQYQLPFVVYNSGTEAFFSTCNPAQCPRSANQNCTSDNHKDGWINPWQSGTNPSNIANTNHVLAWRQQHALVSEQLRICYQLYSGAGTGGIDRPYLEWSNNSGFEPGALNYRAALRSAPFSGAAGTPWGQDASLEPWDPWTLLRTNDGLSAAEVFSILGTVQSCPAPNALGCTKPSSQNDLQPDSYGLLTQIIGATTYPAESYSYNPPGLFPIPLGGFSPPFPFGGSVMSVPTTFYLPSNSRPLIYFLHKPPSATEANLLKPLAEALSGSETPLTIIYLPTTVADASDAGRSSCESLLPVERVRCAFGITSSGNINSRQYHFQNRLYVLSPYDSVFLPSTIPGGTCSGVIGSYNAGEDLDFRLYWYDLLGISSAAGLGIPTEGNCRSTTTAYSIAKSIINDRIYSFEARL